MWSILVLSLFSLLILISADNPSDKQSVCPTSTVMNGIKVKSIGGNFGREVSYDIQCRSISVCNEVCEWWYDCNKGRHGQTVFMKGISSLWSSGSQKLQTSFLCCNGTGYAKPTCDQFLNITTENIHLEQSPEKIIGQMVQIKPKIAFAMELCKLENKLQPGAICQPNPSVADRSSILRDPEVKQQPNSNSELREISGLVIGGPRQFN